MSAPRTVVAVTRGEVPLELVVTLGVLVVGAAALGLGLDWRVGGGLGLAVLVVGALGVKLASRPTLGPPQPDLLPDGRGPLLDVDGVELDVRVAPAPPAPGGPARVAVFYQSRLAAPARAHVRLHPPPELTTEQELDLSWELAPGEVGLVWLDGRIHDHARPGAYPLEVTGRVEWKGPRVEVRPRRGHRVSATPLRARLLAGYAHDLGPARVEVPVGLRDAPRDLLPAAPRGTLPYGGAWVERATARERLLRACALAAVPVTPGTLPEALRGEAIDEGRRFALACGAVLAALLEDGWSTLQCERPPLFCRRGLTGSWEVDTPDDLARAAGWLLNEGHRAAYDLPGALAWDLGRAVNVARWGFTGGLCSERQAWGWALEAADGCRAAFDGWPAFAESYLAGAVTWCERERDEDPERYRRAVDWLLADPASPWLTVSWPK